jgi:hypothetical protein
MARFTLDIEDDYPYILLGINTSLKSYRLAWNLNKVLGIDLKRKATVEAGISGREKADFTFFSTFVTRENAQYRLIENRSGVQLFIPEHPRADFLLVVDQSPETEKDSLIKGLRSIPFISTAFAIDIDGLKSRQNLLLTI